MKKYKVLNMSKLGRFRSPFQAYTYGCIEDFLGKRKICRDFDSDIKKDCAKGFYATDVDGIIYSLNSHEGNKVFEVKVGGKSVVFDKYKQRFKKQKIIREIPDCELKDLIRAESDKMGWNYYEACFPVNPRNPVRAYDKERATSLLEWWKEIYKKPLDRTSFNRVNNMLWEIALNDLDFYAVFRSVLYSANNCLGLSKTGWEKAQIAAYSSSLLGEHKSKIIEADLCVVLDVPSISPLIELWKMGLQLVAPGEKWAYESLRFPG